VARDVYSTLFLAERITGDTAHLGPDASHVYVLRDITVVSASVGDAVLVGQLVLPDTSLVAFWIWFPTPTGPPGQWTGRLVIPPGYEFYLSQVELGEAAYATVSGYTLSLP
jgi:hypothetical protein